MTVDNYKNIYIDYRFWPEYKRDSKWGGGWHEVPLSAYNEIKKLAKYHNDCDAQE
tara:strand:+ start:522 stop:686 length:165 start_codon:yes stop_codon:yes gene_type:complete